MKIAYIVNHLGHTGGVNNMVLDMANIFCQHGHDVTVFYLKVYEPQIVFPCPTVKISMGQAIRFEDYDVVHCHGIRPHVYVMLHRPLRKIKTHFVATLHCYVFQDFRDLYGPVRGFLGSLLYLMSPLRIDTLVCLSKDACQYYRRFFPLKRMTYAYNTRFVDRSKQLSAEELQELNDFKGDATIVGMNSNLILRKGIDVMLNAIELLPNRYKLVICGGYASPEVELLWKEKQDKLKDRVRLFGLRQEAFRYLPHYDIFVLASRSEGFPLSIVEATAFGCKIATTHLPSTDEVFTEGDVAFCTAGDAQGLADAIMRVDQYKDAGQRAMSVYESSLSPEKFYERYMSIYKKEDI